ncbi:hypothetical protein CMU59_11695 [Elizabethkingia anophelis]|uniref:hypothetical protein n=1 Tax=Elizabethkingia anophelis TaxID=1117645 RepID=UPI0021A70899|nr:hypothetical protein [Elizabethkingia anophelis]MCT3947684.1 hypothetical protein [Elizabethkingia anophelis]MDV3573718.1 hypothetical protein [Elizabethkingia anophelis]MDV3598388.1 hypothetical protein [Elizabethkingia anophelis]MDV3606163.1 hypothetical protein [Elizabethkingia anophelis]
MTEAIFGLFGVVLGSGISWFQSYWSDKRETDKKGSYLAIRIVCILDKYIEECANVVKDNGLSFGQRTKDGYLYPQVKSPGPPVYPEDVDWKSINHELMFQILTLQTEVEEGDRIINATWDITGPPDFDEWFIERRFHYSKFGLIAYKLSNDLSEKYCIKKKIYNDWDPVMDFKEELQMSALERQLKIDDYRKIVKNIFGYYI